MDKLLGFLGAALMVVLFIVWNFVLPVVMAPDCSEADRFDQVCTVDNP
jgi:hypothetical protein